MKLGAQEQDLAALRGVIARQSVQLIGLLAVLALALVTVLLMVGRERTVVTPPTLQKSFWVEGDQPRPDEELLEMLQLCRTRGTNLLLDVPPDRHGRIPEASVQALLRLRRNAGL